MHTKGPWTRTAGKMRQVNNPSKLIESPNGEYIVMILDLHPLNRDDEVEANAHLIAAAPELLEALDGATQFIELMGMKVPEDFKRIIAKAKGEQPNE